MTDKGSGSVALDSAISQEYEASQVVGFLPAKRRRAHQKEVADGE
jgi:hypothetical protein